MLHGDETDWLEEDRDVDRLMKLWNSWGMVGDRWVEMAILQIRNRFFKILKASRFICVRKRGQNIMCDNWYEGVVYKYYLWIYVQCTYIICNDFWITIGVRKMNVEIGIRGIYKQSRFIGHGRLDKERYIKWHLSSIAKLIKNYKCRRK